MQEVLVHPQGRRNAGFLHRDAIAAVDVLAVPAQPTLADVTTGGSLAFNTNYKVAISVATIYGPTTPSTVANVTTANDAANTHGVRVTIAQAAGATFYDIFLSVDAAPKLVARITEAQRAAAGTTVTAMGVVGSGGPNPAGTVDVRVVGTGVATTAAPYLVNNAWNIAALVPINCGGYTKAHIHVRLAVTDLRAAPTLTLRPFLKDRLSGVLFASDAATTITLLTAVGEAQTRHFVVDVNGAVGLIVAIQAITGQGAAASVWVELA